MVRFQRLGLMLMVAACLAVEGGAHAAGIEAQTLTQAAEKLLAQPVRAGDDAAIARQLAGLRQAMAEMQAAMARGGWGRVSPGAKLEPGMRDPRIGELRYRLTDGWRELAEQPGLDSALYDPSLAALVKRFQSRHGLTPDGAVGPATLTALNRPPEHRLGQLMIAFDKLRQQAPADDTPRLRVNLPAFTLEIHEGGAVSASMPVVVGRPERPTPQFSSRINQITLNPSWTVPARLAREDLLPKLRRNPDLLSKQGFFAYQGLAASEPVSLASVDWSGVSKARLPYWFRQEPGQHNSLGRYKMSMPNDQDIYLHDTPDRHLFARDNRALSSGCIRVSRPAELAAWLLRHNHGWNPDLIGATIGAGLTTHIFLNRAAPVSLDYQTAWVDSSGAIQYREDIYGLDTHSLIQLLSVLDGQPSVATLPADRQR